MYYSWGIFLLQFVAIIVEILQFYNIFNHFDHLTLRNEYLK